MIYAIVITVLSVVSGCFAVLNFHNRGGESRIFETRSESLTGTVADLRAEVAALSSQQGREHRND